MSMDDNDLDRLLLAETDGVEPSPSFLAEVIAAAQRRAAAPPPLPFPWKWALLGLGAMLAASVGGLSIAGPELVQAALRTRVFGTIEMLLTGVAGWVPAMVLVTLSAAAGCLRSLRAMV
jgi:hypothetical protein